MRSENTGFEKRMVGIFQNTVVKNKYGIFPNIFRYCTKYNTSFLYVYFSVFQSIDTGIDTGVVSVTFQNTLGSGSMGIMLFVIKFSPCKTVTAVTNFSRRTTKALVLAQSMAL